VPPSAPRRLPPLARGGLPRPSAPRAPAAVARSKAQRGFAPPEHTQDGLRQHRKGSPGRRPRNGRFWKAEGGGWHTGFQRRKEGETRRRYAYIASETTRHVVGLVESEYLLATTGRRNRRWDGRQLEMTQDARNDRLLRDGGNDAE
jgi:hypothetical protein